MQGGRQGPSGYRRQTATSSSAGRDHRPGAAGPLRGRKSNSDPGGTPAACEDRVCAGLPSRRTMRAPGHQQHRSPYKGAVKKPTQGTRMGKPTRSGLAGKPAPDLYAGPAYSSKSAKSTRIFPLAHPQEISNQRRWPTEPAYTHSLFELWPKYMCSLSNPLPMMSFPKSCCFLPSK